MLFVLKVNPARSVIGRQGCPMDQMEGDILIVFRAHIDAAERQEIVL